MIIDIRGVSKRYRLGQSKVYAIEDLTMQVEQGEFLIVNGPSGCGKSTLLNLMSAIDQADRGDVIINGVNVAELSEAKRATFRNRHIGIVFQSFNLIPVLSALENVMYPLSLRGDRNARQLATEALNEVGLSKYLHQRPVHLSGGQMQRVAIARAIVTTPSFIFADEPTANLDSCTAQSIIELMKKLNDDSGTTFVIATHHQYVMEQASRVITLRDGVIQSMENQPVRECAV